MLSGPGHWGGTAGPILRQAVSRQPVNAQGPTPSCEDSLEPKSQGNSPKSEACAYFRQRWILYCRVTSQARNLHQKAKKNTSKNKHESQDFMPGTPATHILLAASLASLLTVLILLNQAEAWFHELDLMSAPGSHSSVLKLFRGVTKWFKSRKEGSEVIRRELKLKSMCLYIGSLFLLPLTAWAFLEDQQRQFPLHGLRSS